jgi:eukaryotic-like serine/threonine-protein kinase
VTDEEAIASTVKVGETIAGKFVVESIIGVGGMGVVALATHTQLDEPVALKFLRRDVLTRADIVDRFSREGRAAVKLKSEHVARVTDIGMHGDIPFMVMEYLDGVDLRKYIERGTVPVATACDFMIQVCEGLGEAHARGIVHRDMKPENIFVVERAGETVVKILDFGISKVALTNRVTDVQNHGHTQGVMGSPFYMPPEQLRSTKDVDRRSDIWSLGTVLFEMLSGETAFSDTEEFTELVAHILERPHRSITQIRPDVPIGLGQVIDRCLAKDREQRYQSTGELALDLAPFVRARARAIASRAVAIANSAGFSKGLEVHESMPPPSMSGVPLTLQPSTAAMRTSSAGDMHTARSGGTSKLWIIAPVALLLLAGALFFGAKSGQPGTLPVQNTTNANTGVPLGPSANMTATHAEVVPTAPPVAPSDNVAKTADAPTNKPNDGPKKPILVGPAHPPIRKPVPPTVVTTATPGLDIRRER